MVDERTQGFIIVSEEEAARVRQGRSAAWFEAILDAKMVILPSRPTLSKRMQNALAEDGLRIRTKSADERGFYVWTEPTGADDDFDYRGDDMPEPPDMDDGR